MPRERLSARRIQRIYEAGTTLRGLFGVSSFAKGDQVSVDDEIAVPRRGRATGMNDRTSISQPLGVPREIGVDDRFRTCLQDLPP